MSEYILTCKRLDFFGHTDGETYLLDIYFDEDIHFNVTRVTADPTEAKVFTNKKDATKYITDNNLKYWTVV